MTSAALAESEKECKFICSKVGAPGCVERVCWKYIGGKPMGPQAVAREINKYRLKSRRASGTRGKRTLAGCLRHPMPGVSPRDMAMSCNYLRMLEGWD
jgi:hypothetical protein